MNANMEVRKYKIAPESILLLFLVPLAGFLLYELRELLILLFFSLIFVAALNPFVTSLQRRKFPRPLAVLSVYLSFLAIILLIFSFIIPPLVRESIVLLNNLNLTTQMDGIQFSEVQHLFQNYNSIISQLGGSFQSLIGVLTGTFSGILTTFTFLVVTYYMLIERSHLHRHLVWIFGKNKDAEQRAQIFIDKLEYSLGSWVRGELFLMTVIGFMTFIGLTALGIPYALPLAIIAGLFEAVPNIGPTISSLPAIAIALFTISPTMAGVVILLYIVIQQLENNIIVPRIMAHAADVSPLIAIVVIITGLKLGGVVGTLLSVPLFIFIRTIIDQYYNGQNPLKSLTDDREK